MSHLPPRTTFRQHPGVPLLMNGDRMDADEFEVRYAAMPEVHKAELLEGVVYMPSPVRYEAHCDPHGIAGHWIYNYRMLTPGVRSGIDGTVRLDKKNQPQGDACLFLPESAGGQCRVSEDDYLTGAQELVFEVAASSRSYDLGVKKDVYLKFGVKEYLLWLAQENGIEWFVLRDGEYVVHQPDADAIYRSTVFPGLWLDWKALLTADLAQVFAVLQQGCSTPEHAEFVKRLNP